MRLSCMLLSALILYASPAFATQWAFSAPILNGASASPPNASPALGTSSVILDDVANTLRVQITYSGLVAGTTAAHIHGPTAAPLTGTAGIITPNFPGFDFGSTAGLYDDTLNLGDPSTYSPSFLSASSSDVNVAATKLLNALKASKTYVNIHTGVFPSGEIAGFLQPVATGSGDPQFNGFQGQSFQVHGIPDTIFGIISAPNFQMNSNFAYIGTGGKCDYDNTQCWSHPGTYMDRIGVLMRDPSTGVETRIALIANSHTVGLHVNIDGKPIRYDMIGNNTHTYGDNILRYNAYDQFTVITDFLQITFTNSDHFINLATSLLRPDWLRMGRSLSAFAKPDSTWPHLHGLLGQTWRATSDEQGRQFEGQIDDYVLETQHLFATDFTFNQYQA